MVPERHARCRSQDAPDGTARFEWLAESGDPDRARALPVERLWVFARPSTISVDECSGSAVPVITLNFVMMRANIRELPDFIELAYVLEASNVNATHLVPYASLGNQQQALIHEKALCNRMLDRARDVALKRGITFCEPETSAPVRLFRWTLSVVASIAGTHSVRSTAVIRVRGVHSRGTSSPSTVSEMSGRAAGGMTSSLSETS